MALYLVLLWVVPGFGQSGASGAGGAEMILPECGGLPTPLNRHGCTVIGNRLYIFGGKSSSGWTNETWSAAIEAQGRLGPWRAELPMPERRFYITSAVQTVNNRIYIVGGKAAPDSFMSETACPRLNTVLWTSVTADGSFDRWRVTADVP